jgi:hypothetical protein
VTNRDAPGTEGFVQIARPYPNAPTRIDASCSNFRLSLQSQQSLLVSNSPRKPGNTLCLATMSSPASRRTQRSSATPRRNVRSSLAPHNSSPGQQLRSEASRSSGLTPQRANGNIPTSSPLFYRSSPAGSATNSNGIVRSSPLRQDEDGVNGDSTPRASRPTVAGKKLQPTFQFSIPLTNK